MTSLFRPKFNIAPSESRETSSPTVRSPERSRVAPTIVPVKVGLAVGAGVDKVRPCWVCPGPGTRLRHVRRRLGVAVKSSSQYPAYRFYERHLRGFDPCDGPMCIEVLS